MSPLKPRKPKTSKLPKAIAKPIPRSQVRIVLDDEFPSPEAIEARVQSVLLWEMSHQEPRVLATLAECDSPESVAAWCIRWHLRRTARSPAEWAVKVATETLRMWERYPTQRGRSFSFPTGGAWWPDRLVVRRYRSAVGAEKKQRRLVETAPFIVLAQKLCKLEPEIRNLLVHARARVLADRLGIKPPLGKRGYPKGRPRVEQTKAYQKALRKERENRAGVAGLAEFVRSRDTALATADIVRHYSARGQKR